MTSIPSFSLKVFCPIITTSPPPGSTMYGIVNRTGPHGVSIVGWSGHDYVRISHSWPNDVTTRACPTKASANAVFIIPRCRRRRSTNSSDVAVISELESMRPHREPQDAARHAASAPLKAVRYPPYRRSYRQTRQDARPRHARTKWCVNLRASASPPVPAAAPERTEGLGWHLMAQSSGKHVAAPSGCARYSLAPPSPAARECTHCRQPAA